MSTKQIGGKEVKSLRPSALGKRNVKTREKRGVGLPGDPVNIVLYDGPVDVYYVHFALGEIFPHLDFHTELPDVIHEAHYCGMALVPPENGHTRGDAEAALRKLRELNTKTGLRLVLHIQEIE